MGSWTQVVPKGTQFKQIWLQRSPISYLAWRAGSGSGEGGGGVAPPPCSQGPLADLTNHGNKNRSPPKPTFFGITDPVTPQLAHLSPAPRTAIAWRVGTHTGQPPRAAWRATLILSRFPNAPVGSQRLRWEGHRAPRGGGIVRDGGPLRGRDRGEAPAQPAGPGSPWG